MRNLVPILNDSEYKSALAEASFFIDNEPDPDSREGNRFEILLMRIQSYEAEYYPINATEAGE